MATRTASKASGGAKRKPPARKRSGPPAKAAPAKAAARGAGSKGSTGAKGARRRAAPAPPAPTRGRAPLAGHGQDLAGLGLVALGLLSALAVFWDLAGPAGRALRDGAASAFGAGRYAVPVVLLTAGGLVMWRRPLSGAARLGGGLAAVVVTGCGLLHLARGGPEWGGGADAAAAAGGALGLVAAEPLRSVVGPWGAGLVLATVLTAAALVVARTTARDAMGRAGGAARAGWRLLADAGRLSRERRGDEDAPPAAPERAPARARSAAPAVPVTPPVAEAAPVVTVPPPPEPDPEPPVPATTVHVPTEPQKADQLAIELGPAAQPGAWKLPPLALLKRGAVQRIDHRLIEAGGRALEAALAAHGVETRLVGMTVGPTVTRYELELGAGVKVAKVTNLHKDIAYAMASADVRILAPIPGRSAIGVEVPNQQRELVLLGDVLAAGDAQRRSHPLESAMGRDIAGRPVLVNMADMPHVLIAGATGAGKSSCINSLLTSILMRATPDQVRLILIDPKRVELGNYNGLPHLLTQVVVNPKKAANALAWAVHEMERRYDVLAEVGVRDITGYNAAYDRGDLVPEPGSDTTYPRLPYILVVVDELNDLMMVAARDVEESICRIAQMARAVGIHLVIATQRPSVDVITGVIKANIPSRLAFAVSSQFDSRVILDQVGAERLIGKGDMLMAIAASNVPRRVQGAWVGEDEVRKVVAHWRRQATPQYVEGVEGEDSGSGGEGGGGAAADSDDDEMLEAAMELVVRSQLGSTSMLQRKLRVGFARAGRLMDLLELRGVVGPSEGSKARAVLMTPEELDERRNRAS